MPSMFRDETYAAVLLWLEDTEVQYMPEGKRPGTESYVRYAKYSQGKTVGEALALGSKAVDLCNDYEKKILKIVGGPLRSQPLDLETVADKSTLTLTDRAVGSFKSKVKAMLANQIGGAKASSESEQQTASAATAQSPNLMGMLRRGDASEEKAQKGGAKRAAQQQGQQQQQQQQSAKAAAKETATLQGSPDGKSKKARKGAEETPQKSLNFEGKLGGRKEPRLPDKEAEKVREDPVALGHAGAPRASERSAEQKPAADAGESSVEKQPAADAGELKEPPAKKPRNPAAALEFPAGVAPPAFTDLAKVLDGQEQGSGRTALSNYFQVLLQSEAAAQSLAVALELLGTSAPGAPGVSGQALKDAAQAAFGPSAHFEDKMQEDMAQAVLEARFASESAGSKAVTLVDVAAARSSALKRDEKAIKALAELMQNVGHEGREAFYLLQVLQGAGPDCTLVFEALAHALVYGGKTSGCAELSAEGKEMAASVLATSMDLAFGECGGVASGLAKVLLEEGLEQVPSALFRHCGPQLGTPMLPMMRATEGACCVASACIDEALCQTAGAAVVLEQLCVGHRVQVHKRGNEVSIFDICQRDVSAGRGNLVTGVRDALRACESCMIDGVVQQDGQRLRLVALDCLWVNGRALTRRPLAERREALLDALSRSQSEVVVCPLAKEFPLSDPPASEAVATFLRRVVSSGGRGVVLKRLDGPYEAGRISDTWFSVMPVSAASCSVAEPLPPKTSAPVEAPSGDEHTAQTAA